MDFDNDRTVVQTWRGQPTSRQGDFDGIIGQNTLPAGTRLGEFEILKLIGEGGFGIVYLAHDHSLGRLVALKEYMPSGLAARTQALHVTVRSRHHEDTFVTGLRSFINEARLLARFDSPSLVKVYRFWEENGTAYMVMPFYEGPTLKEALRDGQVVPDEDWTRALLANMFDALETIHREHCFHRDVAPDNILLLRDGRPVLLDFGAARRVIGDLTQSPTVILKPGFAPIEQYADIPGLKQGAWTDIYALGAVVYYLVTGKAPSAAVSRVVHDDMLPAREAGRGRYSDAFLSVIDHALAVKPEHRIQSVADMRHALGLDGVGAHTLPAALGVAPPAAIAALRDGAGPGTGNTRPRNAAHSSHGPLSQDDNKEWLKTFVADERVLPQEPKRSKTALLVSAVLLCTGIGSAVVSYQWLNQSKPEPAASATQAVLSVPPLASSTPDPANTMAPAAPAAPASEVTAGAGSQVIEPARADATGAGPAKPDVPVTPRPHVAPAPDAPASATRPAEPEPAAQEPANKLALMSPVSPVSPSPSSPSPGAASPPILSPEDDFYRAATSRDTIEGYKAYLKRYPRGKHAAAVKLMLENKEIERGVEQKAVTIASANPPPSRDKPASDPGAVSSVAKADKSAMTTAPASSSSGTSSASETPSSKTNEAGRTRDYDSAPAGLASSPVPLTGTSSGGASPPQPPEAGKSTIPPMAKAAPSRDAMPNQPPVTDLPGREPSRVEQPKPERPKADPLPASTGTQRTLSFPGQTMVGNFTSDPISGLVSGSGQIRWDNGDRFEGRLIKGVKEGKGRFTWANGQQYHGDWSEDKPNGKGILVFENGNRYEGDIKDGVPHGTGTTRFRSGDVYTGHWVKGRQDGQGRYTWQNGSYWEGEFKNGVKTENGQLVRAETTATTTSAATNPSANGNGNAGNGSLAEKAGN